MTKAYGYLRVSGRGQVEGDGFPRQEAAIKAYASAHGLVIKRWFKEAGVSGTKELENRPALQRLLLALDADAVQTVIVEKLDRLARDLMVQETIIGDLRKRGYTLISCAEPDLCSEDPSRKLVRQVFGAISEYERAMIVLKLRGARERIRARTGRCEGAKPYGALEGERETLEHITQLSEAGMSYTQVAQWLNGKGVKSRSGGLWYPMTVSRIVAVNK